MNLNTCSIDELKKGYRLDRQNHAYICNYCHMQFPEDQVFSVDGSFYIPEAAAGKHLAQAHGGNLNQLIHLDNKYNSLTDKQKELLLLFSTGKSDHEIAARLGVTTSTVRHQKFTFREKAKQARYYLALFEQVFEQDRPKEEDIVPIHDHATYYDDRYVTTEQEQDKILKACFSSLDPLRLSVFSAKEKKKIVILRKVTELFQPGQEYTEKEVNLILQPVYEDYITLRRYLIMYGFMERDNDGSHYKLL